MKASKFLSYSIVFYFLIPYFLFFRFFSFTLNLDYAEWAWAFKNSMIQSFCAAGLIMLFSLPMSMGLFQLPSQFYDLTKKMLLLPQILPSIFSVLIAFSLWKPFPLGTVGISFIFLIVHLGFAVVFVHTATIEKLGSFPGVSEVFGLGHWKFLTKIFLPLLKGELLACFLMIFIFCFSSLSVPLVAGGGRDTNMEILVFEKIFINQDWSSAWTLGVFQSLFLSGLSLLLLRGTAQIKLEFLPSKYLHSNFGFAMVVIYLFLYLAGYGLGIAQSLPEINQFLTFFTEIWKATLNSLLFLVLYLALSLVLLYLWLYDFAQNYKFNFASHLIAASTMIVGFSFYLNFPLSREWDLLKLPLAMSILTFPVLFKSFLEKPLADLKDQVITAQVFGISNHQIVILILMKRIQRPLMVWFSFLAIWFLSDFAVSRALGTQTETLGLMAQGFLSGYRLSLAYLLSVYILLVWSFVLVLFYVGQEVLSVVDQKFRSSI